MRTHLKGKTYVTVSAPIERRRFVNFCDFSAAHSEHFSYFSSKNTVILDKNCQKMTIVYLNCALWRSIQEWRSISQDAVAVCYKGS